MAESLVIAGRAFASRLVVDLSSLVPTPSLRYLNAGLFLVTLATLMLEVLDTRLLSVLTWYHFSFFAVSVAMLGMAAGAVAVLFGVMHSPYDNGRLFLPWLAETQTPWVLCAAYAAVSCWLLVMARRVTGPAVPHA